MFYLLVENKDQTIKENISKALAGFQKTQSSNGFEILTVNGWDYANLITTYQKASDIYLEFIASIIKSISSMDSEKVVVNEVIKKTNIWIKFFAMLGGPK